MLFRVAARRTDAHRVGDVEPAWAPVARNDGIVLTLARGDNDVLMLRPLDQGGHVLAEQRLGVMVSGAFSARWDLVHQQLLIIRGAPTAGARRAASALRLRRHPDRGCRHSAGRATPMAAIRPLLAALAVSVVLSFGGVTAPLQAPIAAAAPVEAQSTPGGGGISVPNPLDGLASMLSPDNLGKLMQDTAAYLLKQMVNGLHDLLLTLTQGDDNVITHTPPGMTYQQQGVIQRHDALLAVMDWGFAAALVVTGILVILGPSSPLSYPAAGEIVPRVVIAFIAAHSSLHWGGVVHRSEQCALYRGRAGGSISAQLRV